MRSKLDFFILCVFLYAPPDSFRIIELSRWWIRSGVQKIAKPLLHQKRHINLYIFWLFTVVFRWDVQAKCFNNAFFLFFTGCRYNISRRRFHQPSRPNAINEKTERDVAVDWICRSRDLQHKLGRFTKSRLKLFRLVWHYSLCRRRRGRFAPDGAN